MEIFEKKLKRQLEGIDKWVANNGIGTLHWFLAVGKTYAALIVCNRLFHRDPAGRVIVIVPSESLEKQWKLEIKEHIPEYLWLNIEVYTINYLTLNQVKLKCDLLIADEIHEYLTPERLAYLNKTHISYKFILGLTATWQDAQHRERFLTNICPVVDEISEAEAAREGFVQPYIEYNLACALNPQELNEYKAYSDVIAREFPKFKNNLDIAQKCLVGGKHTDGKYYKGIAFSVGWARRNGWTPNGDENDPEWVRTDDLWNPNKIIGYAKTLMMAIRERKTIIYNSVDKADKALQIIKKYPQLKAICFAQSTEFADKVGALINQFEPNTCAVYHSKLQTIIREVNGKPKKIGKTVLKKEAIENIKTGKAKRISTASALDRGFNVVDIRLSITSSGTQNPTQQTQRKGRSIRLEIYAPEVVVLIVNLYIPNTVDEKWLRKRQKKSVNTIYWVNSVDDINHTPTDIEVISPTLI